MNKQTFLLVFLLFINLGATAQNEVNFEQNAFDYYVENLKDKNLKATLWLKFVNYSDFEEWFPRCLGSFQVNHLDLDYPNASQKRQLVLSSEIPNFNIKPISKGVFPHVYVSTSFSNRPDQQIGYIIEEFRYYGNIYFIEFDREGEDVQKLVEIVKSKKDKKEVLKECLILI
jgi:hypothetical protein